MSNAKVYQEALKKASSTIEQLIAENERLRRREPTAIIGMGCRLPGGANSPEEYWALLSEGRDAVSFIPAERWPVSRYFDENADAPGKMYIREGGFLDCSPYDFDPRFFGISPKEAKALDPQQRLLLETAWEALEDAGINPASLQGSRTGVFIGISSSDYQCAHLFSNDPSLIDPYSMTGITFSTAAGRLSYVLGLEGPNFPVDTACSSSLVALHLACRSLRDGECDLALVGGVNLMLTPEPLISFCKLRALSPDGRCKSFDASANGYGRGEGCGMIVLKRLEAARLDNDRILALVKGSALNNDGRSSGLTTPNGIAQRRVIASALEDAALQPGDIDYVEAHGTGTPLGDPIEVEAVAAALGKGRDASHPLLIGSVKTNIGHLEAAAGVAGIIKLILSMNREKIPPHLHFHTPNFHVGWDDLPLKVVADGAPWPRSIRPRRAGISGFGFNGTNAHVILEEAPLPEPAPFRDGRTAHLLVMSATDETALRALAGLYAAYLRRSELVSLAAICNTAATGRKQFSHGLAVAGGSPEEMAQRLSPFAVHGTATGLHPRPPQAMGKQGPVFLFTGQGSQYPGMGKGLYDTAPVYREALDRCDALFAPLLGLSIRDLMHNGSEEELARTIYTQAAIFALEYSLARLWLSWGVEPSALLGHSIGEFVAACIAGVLSLEDAATLVAHRGRLINALPAGGVMAAVLCSEAKVLPVIAPYAGQVSVAAVNTPGAVVISGEQAGIALALEALKQQGVSSQYLRVSHAFHSHLMEPVLDGFEAIAAGLKFQEPRLPVISNVTGKPATGTDLRTASYWRRHLRGAVRFSDSVQYLKQQGHDLFLEIGATATLSSFVRRIAGAESRCAASLKRETAPWSTLAAALGELFAAGVAIDWKGYDAPYRAAKVSLPTYPFQRERYVMDPVREPAERGTTIGFAPVGKGHPLLGGLLDSPSSERRYAGAIGTTDDVWLTGHAIYGEVIVPAAAYLELALAAVSPKAPPASPLLLERARFIAPLILTEERTDLQTICRPETGGVEVFSRAGGGPWQLHADMTTRFPPVAKFSFPASPKAPSPLAPHEIPAPLAGEGQGWKKEGGMPIERGRQNGSGPLVLDGIERDGAAFYDELLEKGYRYGGVFRSIRRLRLRGADVYGDLEVSQDEGQGFVLHPALLDGCLTLAGASFLYGAEPLPDGIVFVPTAIESLLFSGGPVSALSVRCRQREQSHVSATFDLYASNRHGEPVLQINGLVMRRLRKEQLLPLQQTSLADLMYRQIWRESPPAGMARAFLNGRWLLLADHAPFCAALAEAIGGAGADLTVLKVSNLDSGHDVGIEVESASYDALQRLVGDLHKDGAPLAGVISLWGDSLHANLDLVQALLAVRIAPRLFLVTRAAHDPTGAESDISPQGAALWGFGASVTSEAPELSTKLLDLSPLPGQDELAALVRELAATDGEDRIALRGGRRFVPRLVRDGAQTGQNRKGGLSGVAGSAMIDPSGAYLVTGGLGALGLAVAGWLVDEGCRHLALMGRSAPSADALAAVERFRLAGAQVAVVTADVAEEADVVRMMTELRAAMPPLKGIFHAAGLLDDAMLADMDAHKLDRVMRPKIAGAWNLHRATEGDDLELFVLFSSLTAVTGSPGQANYAAANAALDGFARWRRSRGLAAVSINWGPWGEAGLSARDGRSDRLTARGIRSIKTDTGLQALAAVLRANPVAQCVADLDLHRLSSFIPTAGAGLYSELFTRGEHPSGDMSDMLQLDALRQAPPAERTALMLLLVQKLAAMVMGQNDPTRIEGDRPLQEQGFDSLMALELRNFMTKTFNMELPVSLLFDYPTPEKIGRFLLDEALMWSATGKSASIAAGEGESAAARWAVVDIAERSADDLVDDIEQLLRL